MPFYSDGLEDFLLVILKHFYFKFFFNLPTNFWESSKFCVSMINNHKVFLASAGYIAEAGLNQTHGNPPSSADLQVTLIFATLCLKLKKYSFIVSHQTSLFYRNC